MSTYQRYQQARDAAWKTLIACKCAALPINAKGVARQLGVEVFPFPAENTDTYHLLEKAGGGVCRSLRIQGKWHIFLKTGALDDQRAHFAVAHELGHVILRHDTRALCPGVRAFGSRENAGDVLEDPLMIEDYAADIFAIRLLAPACVLRDLHILTAGEMLRRCGLPPKAAALRAERMALLRDRDAFLSHPLERQVHQQFFAFIEKENGIPMPPSESPLSMEKKPQIRERKKRRGLLIALGAGAALIGGILCYMILFT